MQDTEAISALNLQDVVRDEPALAALLAPHEALAAGGRSGCLAAVRGVLAARRKPKRGAPAAVYCDLVCGSKVLQLASYQPTAGEVSPLRTLPLGSVIEARGEVCRTAAGQLSLLVEARPQAIVLVERYTGTGWTPEDAAALCSPEAERCFRFHLVPSTVRWQRQLFRLGVGAHNSLPWRGGTPLPTPPPPSPPPHGAASGAAACWLLPASDAAALAIARQQEELRAAGWRLLTASEEVVCRLGNKVLLRDHAARLGLLGHLPVHYASPSEARYPCVFKKAEGEPRAVPCASLH